MKQLLQIKVKAGALQYTIFISVVIALLVFAFLGLTFINQKLRLKNDAYKQVVHQNNLAFNYLKNNSTVYNEPLKLPLANGKNIETTVTKKHWGIFDIVISTSKKRKEETTQIALLGGHQQKRPALYLQDENQPLVVVGTTKIEGTSFLPNQGIKQGSIAGYSYQNSQLIYGDKQTSNQRLPKALNCENLLQFKEGILNSENYDELELQEGQKIFNSFNAALKKLYATQPIDLRSIQLVGNIVVQSDVKITVHKSAVLSDIILIAPEIEIKEKTKGNFQAFATKNITVAKNIELNYPSVLMLTEKQNRINQQQNIQEEHRISIGDNSLVKGIVSFIAENKENEYSSQIVIEENAEIIGEVYCNKNIELKGTVKGSIYTKGFIANQSGAVYKNHIYNGKILSSELPEQYVGLTFKNSNQNVAKWLYY